jgi:polyhydroxyalkanoate synthesis repressor PhaR
MSQPRVIKRYANRKMYDTSRSCYVTLEEVAELVRSGHEVQVIDNKTKADLTEVVLTQALLDAERKQRGSVPLAGLRSLIAQGNDFLQKKVAQPVSRVREEAQRSVHAWRDEAERTVQVLRHEAERVLRPHDTAHHESGGGKDSSAADSHAHLSTAKSQAEHPAPRKPVKRWPINPQKAYEDWQHLLDERLRQALAVWVMPEAVSREIAELRATVATQQARIEALEARLANGEDTAAPRIRRAPSTPRA